MSTSRAALVIAASAVGVVIGVAGAYVAHPGRQHQAAAAAGTAIPAVNPYSCRLEVGARYDATHSRDGAVQTVALNCPGQPLLHLPGPYGPRNVLPAGLFHLPGWQVQQLLYVQGETRLWLVDEHQSCLLRYEVTTPGAMPGTQVTCNLTQLQAPAPAPTPVTPSTAPAPEGRPA